MRNIPVYILTLENRKDRQDQIEGSLSGLRVNFEFMYSKKSENQVFLALPMANQTEIAIWNSHTRAMRKFLLTDSKWAMILEDDAITKNIARNFFEQQIEQFAAIFEKEVGIIQLGWIPNSQKSGMDRLVAIFFRIIFRENRFDFKSKITYIKRFGFWNYRIKSKNISNIAGMKLNPLLGMRLGTHAYLIDRSTASKLIQRFEKRNQFCDFKTIDQDLLSLTGASSNSSEITAIRFNKSLLDQLQIDSDNLNKTIY